MPQDILMGSFPKKGNHLTLKMKYDKKQSCYISPLIDLECGGEGGTGTHSTQDYNGIILAQNKDFNFQWEILQNEDTSEFFIFGNHTKKCEKNSLAIFEIMQIEPVVLAENKEKLSAVARKFKSSSELGVQIKKLRK